MAGLIKKILPQSLFGRSMLIIVTPVLLFQIIVTIVFFDRHWRSMTNRLSYALVSEISMIIASVESLRDEHDILPIIESTARHLELLVSYDPDAKIDSIFSREWMPASVYNEFSNEFQKRIDKPFNIRAHEREKWYEIQIQLDSGKLTVLCPERRLYSATTYIFMLWMIGSAFVLFAIAMVFMRNQIRPIKRLATAAERFGRGQDMPAFKPTGAAEVRQAAAAFIEMRERIRRQVEQRTAMLAGVSHDLRTPITRMKLQLEMMDRTSDTDALRLDLAEMEKMVEGYLTFIRGEGDEPHETVDMNKIAEKIASDYRRQGYAVTENPAAEPLAISVRPGAIERAISNLVANACKYAKNVWITAYRLGNYIEISIDDDGPGIPPDMREDVFKPFVRLEKSRNKKTGGIGLGLSIAQDIILSHGGQVLLEDSTRGGLRAVVRLPA